MTILNKGQRAVTLWALLLGLLASQVAQGRLRAFDQDLAQTVAAWRSSAWDMPVRAATFFGSSAWTVMALAALAWMGWRRARTSILMFLGAFVLGVSFEALLRIWVMQWRPDTTVAPVGADLMATFHLAGFPSGHAFRSAFLFGWIAQELGRHHVRGARLWQAGCVAIILMVGIGRLYVNRHWASDVLGGWLVACVVLSIATFWQTALKSEV